MQELMYKVLGKITFEKEVMVAQLQEELATVKAELEKLKGEKDGSNTKS